MNIGKVTLLNNSNYGNVLQDYALNKTLMKFDANVDSLWNTEEDLFGHMEWKKKDWIKFIINWKNNRRNETNGKKKWEMIRQTNIRRFRQKYINTCFVDYTNIERKYDFIVVGSDQVWNPYFSSTRCRTEFLTFVPSSKRISYAASIGISLLPMEDKANFRQWLLEMPHISVREQVGVKIVKDLTGMEVPIHVDPTLLLGAEEWASLEETPAWYDGKPYICTYFLGERPTAVDEIAVEGGLSVINILDKEVFDHYITSPEEFLWLIHHASLVYTDSFHGTVFSILFERSFVVCDRVEAGGCNMRSRIDTLLGLFHLENRYAKAETGNRILEPFKMEYPDLAPIFARERQRSHDYLKNALGVKD